MNILRSLFDADGKLRRISRPPLTGCSGLQRPERAGSAEPPSQRAIKLLAENLTLGQLRQYANCRNFDVIGGESGKPYRIWHCFQQNIEELDARGRRCCIWCFHPRDIVLSDVLLAQKTALELFEADAMSIARRYGGFAESGGPDTARACEDYFGAIYNL